MSKRKQWPMVNILNSSLVDLPAPSNITNMWNFGSMLGLCLGIQIVTGIFLAMQYTADITTAFECINHIMRDVSSGWFVRMTHANGASVFFFVMFIHIGRGLYFKSYLLNLTWILGVLIFLVSMLTAFLGYVLPWGQMSYWGATVITNLLSAVPYLGETLVEWIWGGFSVNNATLNRFFSFHYLFPFIVSVLVVAHLVFLHEQKSSNPLGIQMGMDKIPFHPYFSTKDFNGISLLLTLFLVMNMVYPFVLMDPENFTPANPLSTPVHIQPEWYFLFAYAILRCVPNKLGGVLALIFSILILLPLALPNKTQQFNKMQPSHMLFWWFIMFFIMLTWLGMKPVETPYLEMSSATTFLYFSWFLVTMNT